MEKQCDASTRPFMYWTEQATGKQHRSLRRKLRGCRVCPYQRRGCAHVKLIKEVAHEEQLIPTLVYMQRKTLQKPVKIVHEGCEHQGDLAGREILSLNAALDMQQWGRAKATSKRQAKSGWQAAVAVVEKWRDGGWTEAR
eukprot:556655-Pelagomonas_calceolata.AAC.3